VLDMMVPICSAVMVVESVEGSLTDIHEVQVNVRLDRETAHAPRQIRPFGSVFMSVQPSSR